MPEMIEVEKKVMLTEAHINEIETNATFLHTKSFSDTYFDTTSYTYTLQNMWLRKRAETFELKVGIIKEGDTIDRYDELTEPSAIYKTLGIELNSNLENDLANHAIVPFCTFTTTRTKYQLGPYTIDIDHAVCGSMTYDIAEIERLVNTPDEIPKAEQSIYELIAKLQIDPTIRLLGKLPYFLSKLRKDHFQALVMANVIQLPNFSKIS